MFKCAKCGAEFAEPKQYEWWSKHEQNDDIILICPKCGDDRIQYKEREEKQ